MIKKVFIVSLTIILSACGGNANVDNGNAKGGDFNLIDADVTVYKDDGRQRQSSMNNYCQTQAGGCQVNFAPRGSHCGCYINGLAFPGQIY
jgi:hypothetical protein